MTITRNPDSENQKQCSSVLNVRTSIEFLERRFAFSADGSSDSSQTLEVISENDSELVCRLQQDDNSRLYVDDQPVFLNTGIVNQEHLQSDNRYGINILYAKSNGSKNYFVVSFLGNKYKLLADKTWKINGLFHSLQNESSEELINSARTQIINNEPLVQKNLLLDGEVFSVDGKTAFLFRPETISSAMTQKPWILYSPTLPNYPDQAEYWMHREFVSAGVAVAGIDTGESYGSPEALAANEKLYEEMVARGYSKKPAVFGRSRGGLWASAWAIAHPDRTAGVAGIYPVFDWRVYPGVEIASHSYGLSREEMIMNSSSLCPVEQLHITAEADVPFFLIHGDSDSVVPIESNSLKVKEQYESLGKGNLVTLIVAEGQGHKYWEGYFRCRPLVDFLINQARESSDIVL